MTASLARKFGERKTTMRDLRQSSNKAVGIGQWIVFRGAIIEPEYLLIYVPLKVKRLHGNVGSLESPLQERPEIFDSVRVNLSAHVLFRVSHDFVDVLEAQVVVSNVLIGENFA